ncbi:hypothetical protein AMECASPLE_011441 [Ameca splendens]|uniref:Uncharacterized protein n=1 Tax=Ameca splendens TaxID=208324 RepID=A0ABV0XDV5_9TELE
MCQNHQLTLSRMEIFQHIIPGKPSIKTLLNAFHMRVKGVTIITGDKQSYKIIRDNYLTILTLNNKGKKRDISFLYQFKVFSLCLPEPRIRNKQSELTWGKSVSSE